MLAQLSVSTIEDTDSNSMRYLVVNPTKLFSLGGTNKVYPSHEVFCSVEVVVGSGVATELVHVLGFSSLGYLVVSVISAIKAIVFICVGNVRPVYDRVGDVVVYVRVHLNVADVIPQTVVIC